jgi:hypothetical protein
MLFLLVLTLAPLQAGEPEYPFLLGFRQELVHNRVLGNKSESFLTADYRFGCGFRLMAGYAVNTASGGVSGYHLGAASPVFGRWFAFEGYLVDRVFPDYGKGYLSYLLLFRYEARMPGFRDTRPSFKLSGRVGANFHFFRGDRENLHSPFPLDPEYSQVNWAYDLRVLLVIPLAGAVDSLDLTLGVRNFTRQEAAFTGDYTNFFRADLDAGRFILFFEGGVSPAGNFFLSGTWHTFYCALGVTVCF